MNQMLIFIIAVLEMASEGPLSRFDFVLYEEIIFHNKNTMENRETRTYWKNFQCIFFTLFVLLLLSFLFKWPCLWGLNKRHPGALSSRYGVCGRTKLLGIYCMQPYRTFVQETISTAQTRYAKAPVQDTFLPYQDVLNVSSCSYKLLHFCDTFVY